MANNTKPVGVAYEDPVLNGALLGGSSTDTVGFFGTTPSAQRANSSQAAISTSAAAQISATQWGFATSTQADAIVTLANEMRAVLVALGIMKGSA